MIQDSRLLGGFGKPRRLENSLRSCGQAFMVAPGATKIPTIGFLKRQTLQEYPRQVQENEGPRMSTYPLAFLVLAGLSAHAPYASKHGPDCSGGWPTNMAQSTVKNAGLLTTADIDFLKTSTIRLASEYVAKDLWHQVYLVKFSKKSGGDLEAIVIHDASMEECSMTAVQVFLVSKHLQSR